MSARLDPKIAFSRKRYSVLVDVLDAYRMFPGVKVTVTLRPDEIVDGREYVNTYERLIQWTRRKQK